MITAPGLRRHEHLRLAARMREIEPFHVMEIARRAERSRSAPDDALPWKSDSPISPHRHR
jgi:hypothetical protein